MAKAKAKETKVKETSQEVIVIPKPDYDTIKVKIVGETPIRIHRLGAKAKRAIGDLGANRARGKEPRNYDEEFLDSLYYIDEKGMQVPKPQKLVKTTRIGFPASAFKKAMVCAARQFQNISMAELRGRFFVCPYSDFVEIKGIPKIDKFWRRIGSKGPGTGTPDIGVRAMVFPWSAELEIRYLRNVISAETLLRLLSVAGFSVGVGEDRPDKTGNKEGMWLIAANGQSK